MAFGLIDVWDAETFDEDLLPILVDAAELIRNHMTTERKIFLRHDLKRNPGRPVRRRDNRFAHAFHALTEALGKKMACRTIRGGHYTHLTDPEVDVLQRHGVHLSTAATLQGRLDAAVAFGALAPELAETLYAASPFHSDQMEARANRFWMTSHPRAIDDDGIESMISRWGGEAASMWVQDPELLAPLGAIGKARVLELAVPLALTRHGYSAAEAVIATFGPAQGCVPAKGAFDLYVIAPLQPDAVLRVHSEGDALFNAVGRRYPRGCVDLDIGCWKEFMGEDE